MIPKDPEAWYRTDIIPWIKKELEADPVTLRVNFVDWPKWGRDQLHHELAHFIACNDQDLFAKNWNLGDNTEQEQTEELINFEIYVIYINNELALHFNGFRIVYFEPWKLKELNFNIPTLEDIWHECARKVELIRQHRLNQLSELEVT